MIQFSGDSFPIILPTLLKAKIYATTNNIKSSEKNLIHKIQPFQQIRYLKLELYQKLENLSEKLNKKKSICFCYNFLFFQIFFSYESLDI